MKHKATTVMVALCMAGVIAIAGAVAAANVSPGDLLLLTNKVDLSSMVGVYSYKYDSVAHQYGNEQLFIDLSALSAVYGMGMAYGPDGNLYIAVENNKVKRYNGTTGAFIDDYVTGLSDVEAVSFSPSGRLCVSDGKYVMERQDNGSLALYAEGVTGPVRSMVWGPDGNLYFADNSWPAPIWKVDSVTKDRTMFATQYTITIAWGPDVTGDGVAELFDASMDNGNIYYFDGVSGAGPTLYGQGGPSYPCNIAWGGPGNNLVVSLAGHPGLSGQNWTSIYSSGGGWLYHIYPTGGRSAGAAFVPGPTVTPMALADAKQADEGRVVEVSGAVISAAFTDFLYIENPDRSSGMRVNKAGHGLSSGTYATVTGAVKTAESGERCIDATSIVTGGSAAVAPVGMNNKAVGGGPDGLQGGVFGGSGLNTIGLLVKVWGSVSGSGPYTLDDGSGAGIKMVVVSGSFTGSYIAATGVVSCEKDGDDLKPVLIVKDATTDIVSSSSGEISTLVQDGQSRCCIVRSASQPAGVTTAATDLAEYIRRMSGAIVPIRLDTEECPGFRILLGSTRFASVSPSEVDSSLVGFDGFIIRSVPDGVVIAGRNAAGTVNGIYHFAEEVLGVHWFSLEDSIPTVPNRSTITVSELNLVAKPAFDQRAPYYSIVRNYWTPEQRAAEQKWRNFNRVDIPTFAYNYHSFYWFVPDSLYNQHPEYWSLINGLRVRGDEHVQRCLSNPNVLQLAINHCATQFDQNPQLVYASLSPNDGFGWCECSACAAMGPTPSHQMLAFANAVASALETRYPNKGYLFYAYQATLLPPTGMTAHPNVHPIIAPMYECNIHPMSSDCPDRVKLREVYDGWAQIAGKFGVYFYLNGGVFVTPGVRMIADELKYVRNKGCFISWREHTSAPLVNWAMIAWVESRLMWDTNRDVVALRRQFIEGYYGLNAADRIERVYEGVESGIAASPPSHSTWTPYRMSQDKNWPFDKLRPLVEPVVPDIQAAMTIGQSEIEPFRGRILRDMGALLGQ